MAECEKRKELRQIIDCKDRILLVHATTGTARAVREVLADSGVLTRLSDSKAAGEVAVLNAFFEMLRVDPERAYYGYDHVRKCHEAGAIETLLVTDGLFRAADLPTRRRYVDLTDDVKAAVRRVVRSACAQDCLAAHTALGASFLPSGGTCCGVLLAACKWRAVGTDYRRGRSAALPGPRN